MKLILTWLFLLVALEFSLSTKHKVTTKPLPVSQNLFIITLDGYRWQEVFTGADSSLINDPSYTADTAYMKMMYWAATPVERRKKLMPFFWNVLNQQGQLYGNRHYNNKVDVANLYKYSYPGYNEIFTGNTDITVSTNGKKENHNVNVLEYLSHQKGFEGKVAAFTSWDVFPFILNEQRSGLPVNSGYTPLEDEAISTSQQLTNKVEEDIAASQTGCRYDMLTFLTAKNYIQQHQPRVVFLGLGETDESAHQGKYDQYLQRANDADKMIAELWHWVQTTPGYKNNTTFIITTDHGRGRKPGKWNGHGAFIGGSSETWLAIMGPGIAPLGEIKTRKQLYQKQLAETIVKLVGEDFKTDEPVAEAVTLATVK